MSSLLKSLQMEHWYDVLEVSPMPGELRDLLTKSHELEIQLQSVLERNDRVSEAFFEAAHNMTDEERGCHFVRIKQYYKEEEDLAKEKVAVMQSVEDLLERYKLVVDQEYNRLRAALDEENAGRADRIERRVKQEMERQNATLERVHVAGRNGRRRKRVHAPKIAGGIQPASTQNGGDATTTVSKKSGNSESDNQLQSSSQLTTRQANSDAPTVLANVVVKTEQRSDVELPAVKPTPQPLVTTKNESRHGRLRKVSSRVTALLDVEAAATSTTRDHHHHGSHGRSKASKKASTVNTEVVAQADANAEAGDIDDQSIYCYCNQPSFGSMVACDSLTCKYEWFHYECVGVTEAPKGDWYCPDCRNNYWTDENSMSLFMQMDNQSPVPSHLAEINENKDRLIKKIEDIGVKIKAAMKTKEADVDEFLRVSGKLHDHESDNPQLLRIRVLFNRKNRKTTQLINSLQLTKLSETGSMRRGITETVLTNVGQGLKDVGVNIKESLSEYTGSVINAPKDLTRRLLKSKSGSADSIALSSTADKHKPAIGSIQSGAKEEDSSAFYFPLHSEDVESSSKDEDQSELSSPIQGISRGFEDPDDLDPFFEEVRALQNAVTSLSREIDRLKAQIQQEYNFFHGALHEEKYRYQHLEDLMNDMVELHQAEISNLKEEVQMIEGRLQYQFRDQIQDIQDLIGQMQAKVEFLEKSTKELQQAVGLENLSDSSAGGQAIRALLLFLQILIMLLVTLWNINSTDYDYHFCNFYHLLEQELGYDLRLAMDYLKPFSKLCCCEMMLDEMLYVAYFTSVYNSIAVLQQSNKHFTSRVAFQIQREHSLARSGVSYLLPAFHGDILDCAAVHMATLILTQKVIALLSSGLKLSYLLSKMSLKCNLCDELVKSEEPLLLTCGCKLNICGYCLTRSVNQKGCCPGCHAYVGIIRESDEVFLDDFTESEQAKTRSGSTKSRRNLADLRVLQNNLVSVYGLPLEIADPDTLRSDEYFGRFGKIIRILMNKKGKTPTAYITFQRSEDAMQAVAEFGKNNFLGQTARASLGTTKYCVFFLKNSICKNKECHFMHSVVPDEATFTKEDMEKGKHIVLQKKLVDDYIKHKAVHSMKLHFDTTTFKKEPPSKFPISKKNGTAWGKIDGETRNPIFGDCQNDENSVVAKNKLEKNDCSPLGRKWQASEMRKLREKNNDNVELVENTWNDIHENQLKNLFGGQQSNFDAECETVDRNKVIHIPCQQPYISFKMANGVFLVSDATSPSQRAFSSEAEPVETGVSTEGKRFAFDGKFENKSDSHLSDSFSVENLSGSPCPNDFPPLSVPEKRHNWKENAMVGTKFDENFFGSASRISGTNSASASQVFLHTIEALKNAECMDDSTLPRFRLNQNASAMMNINRMVKIVATGYLKASDTFDAIVIGTTTHILVYDVKNNCDLFYKEVSGGLESILIGRFGDFEEELIVCGGSCALQGFSWQGKEIFWSAVTNLLSLGSNRFAYALANGTLGVYASACRLWRIKSKANPTFLCLYDIDGDDEQELVTGWSSGKIDFRKCQNGELVAKDHMNSAIVGIEIFGLSAKDGAYLLCCSSSGEVRGYFAYSGQRNLIPVDTVRDTIRNLSIERQNLLVELENYEEKEIAAQSQLSSDNTTLRIPPYLQLSLCTNNRCVLRGAIIFAERIFPGESYAFLVPKEESCEKLEIPLRLEKDTASDLHIKALVGYSRSSKLCVFDLNQALPKFSMYALCNDTAPCPKNGVEFNIGDRGELLCQWLMKNFLIDQANLSRDKFTVRFMNLRISCLIFIKLNDNGKVEICCDDIEVCGSMMQSLASYVDLEFKVTAHFPDTAKKYADLAKKVSKVSAVQDRLSADMSEQISIAKSVLLHGEDSRVLEDWDKMKEHYKQLSSLNDTLLSLQNVRLGNSAHLSDLLKRINRIIQNASNLKVGKHRSALIRACRSAIAAGNTASVRKLLDLDG
ncbi:Bardet-Biedl syndrome 2 -like protein [Trichinella patagoniensis]|uniref:Inhibitor of growth protein n=1 Tax=Trichinella patagoniensis TaxID=990121 RepID=A0A0V1AAI4_9BILA|nr:Bardet-Biedl syndrome 2 -like protein [Trichinella patagoniensis]